MCPSSKHSWTRYGVRRVLPGLKRETETFKIKVNFAFHLELKILEADGGVERHRLQGVRSFWVHGICWCLWWLVQSQLSFYQEIFRACQLPPADRLISLAAAHSAKATTKWFAGHVIAVLNGPANSPNQNTTENLQIWDIITRKIRNTRPKRAEGGYQFGSVTEPTKICSCPGWTLTWGSLLCAFLSLLH